MRPNILLVARQCKDCETAYMESFNKDGLMNCPNHERYFNAYWDGLGMALRLALELDE